MTIHYSLTRGEMVLGFFQGLRRSRRLRLTLTTYSLCTAAIAMAIGGTLSRPWSAADLATALLWALGAFAFLPLVLYLRGKTEQRTLTISPAGISTRIGRMEGDLAWRQVKTVVDAGAYLLVAGASGNAFLTPNRAFADSDERGRFLRLVEDWRRDNA